MFPRVVGTGTGSKWVLSLEKKQSNYPFPWKNNPTFLGKTIPLSLEKNNPIIPFLGKTIPLSFRKTCLQLTGDRKLCDEDFDNAFVVLLVKNRLVDCFSAIFIENE